MSKLLDRITDAAFLQLEQRWPRPSALGLAIVTATAATGWAVLSTWKSLDLPSEMKWYCAGAASAMAMLLCSVFCYRAWKGHRTTDGCVGVVVALAADSEEEDRVLRSEFISSLRELFRQGSPTYKFEVLVAPRRLAEAICDGGEGKALTYMAERKGHLLIVGKVRAVDLGRGRSGRHVALNGYVRHSPVGKDASRELAADMDEVLPRRLLVLPEGRLFQFEAASEWLDLATRYVVGIAAMMSGDLHYAETLLLHVEQRLPIVRKAYASHLGLKQIERKVPDRIVALYSQWLLALNVEYFRTRELALLSQMERVADSLLMRVPSSYGAKIAKALCIFGLRRDVRNARKFIAKCKLTSDAAWRYSEAFLLAYSGNLTRANAEYARAFRAKTDDVSIPVQCEEFIQILIDAEPHQGQLHFCAGLINCFAKSDHVAARRDFEIFIRWAGERFPEEKLYASKLIADLESGQVSAA